MSESVFRWAVWLYSGLLPFGQAGVVAVVLIALPLAAFQRSRGVAGSISIWVSYLAGLCTWLLGFAFTLASTGWWGVLFGLGLFGIGVVPIGAVGSYFHTSDSSVFWALIGMSAVSVALRALGLFWKASYIEWMAIRRVLNEAEAGPTGRRL